MLVDVRSFGADWYNTLTLPNKDTLTYIVPVIFDKMASNRRSISMCCPLLRLEIPVDNVYVELYVHPLTTSGPTYLVDDVLVSENPSLLVSRKTAELSTEDPQAKTSNPSTLQTSLL